MQWKALGESEEGEPYYSENEPVVRRMMYSGGFCSNLARTRAKTSYERD